MILSSELVQTKRPEDFIGVVVAGVAAGLGISYWYNREPNEVKRLRALELCEMYEEKLHAALVRIKEPKDVVRFISQSSDLHNERKKLVSSIALSTREMGNRYAHPLKPWNWSDDMKDMFNRIQKIHDVTQTVTIMYRYQSLFEILLQNTKPAVKREAIIDDLLESDKIKYSYPMIAYANKIEKDVESLLTSRDRVSVEDGQCAYVVIGMLREVYNSIVQSDEYIEEMRHQKELGLKTVQLVASEVQTKAKNVQNLTQQQYVESYIRRQFAEILRKEREEMQHQKAKEQERASLPAQLPFAQESVVIPVGHNSQQDT